MIGAKGGQWADDDGSLVALRMTANSETMRYDEQACEAVVQMEAAARFVPTTSSSRARRWLRSPTTSTIMATSRGDNTANLGRVRHDAALG